jgi:predicted SprT family Zn-dependent metalloprotease
MKKRKKTFRPYIPEVSRAIGETKLTQFGFISPQITPSLNSWEKKEFKSTHFYICYFCGETFQEGHGKTHKKNKDQGFCDSCLKNLELEPNYY